MIETGNEAVAVELGMGAKPFLKWAGGKSQLLPQFEAHYPPQLAAGQIATYIEPFLGGGATFLSIAQHYPFHQAYLTDINPELILAYTVVQRDPIDLIAQLEQHQQAYDAGNEEAPSRYFYTVRQQYNAQRPSIHDEITFDHYSSAWVT